MLARSPERRRMRDVATMAASRCKKPWRPTPCIDRLVEHGPRCGVGAIPRHRQPHGRCLGAWRTASGRKRSKKRVSLKPCPCNAYATSSPRLRPSGDVFTVHVHGSTHRRQLMQHPAEIGPERGGGLSQYLCIFSANIYFFSASIHRGVRSLPTLAIIPLRRSFVSKLLILFVFCSSVRASLSLPSNNLLISVRVAALNLPK